MNEFILKCTLINKNEILNSQQKQNALIKRSKHAVNAANCMNFSCG